MPATAQAIRPHSAAKSIEERANGPAVTAFLQHDIAGVIVVNPEGGKTFLGSLLHRLRIGHTCPYRGFLTSRVQQAILSLLKTRK